MRSHSGVAAHMFEALATAGINIQMISTSEIKTAVTIREEKIDEAARAVHSAFGLDNEIARRDSRGGLLRQKPHHQGQLY